MKPVLLTLLATVVALFPLYAQNQTITEPAITSPKEKIETIILPDLVLKDASLRQAIDTLKNSIIKANTAEPNPAHRGVNIVLKMPPGMAEKYTINLNMKTPTPEAVFLEIAKQSECLVVSEPYAIAIVPNTESVPPDQLIFDHSVSVEGELQPYDSIIKASKLESLADILKKVPKIEIYRFYIFRSFNPALIFDVGISDQSCTVEWKIIRNFGDLNENYRVTQSSMIPLDRPEIQPLLEILKGADFWNLPKTLPTKPSTDGSDWVVEAVKDGKHHLVIRCNPLTSASPNADYREGLLVGAFTYLWALTHQMDGELY